jgi:phosphoglycolate phosphatase-like HAD superfamily hydrolase
MDRLILFDIDGTLTRTQNGYLPFNEAVLRTFGFAGDIRQVVPDGNTDPLIVKDIFAKSNRAFDSDSVEWPRFMEALRGSYDEHVSRGLTTIRPLPGALELLRALSHGDSVASVVTGNFEATAQVKLLSAGLARYLTRGAYASDSARRPDLPAIAKARCEQTMSRTIRAAQCVIVGDTPKDLAAARANSMKCVLVGTGRYPIEELEYWRPDACLSDLSDTQAVLEIIANL